MTVGGTTAGAGNVFAMTFGVPSGNDDITTGLVFQGNFVGTDRTGTIALGTGASPGDGVGISVGDAAKDPQIGGTNPGEGNTIAFVDGYGVIAAAQYPKVLGNSIYSNTLDGLYVESEGGHVDPSNGVHLTNATATEIDGTYQGAFGDYRLEFFATPVEPAGSPYAASNDLQGKTFLGSENETEGPSGVINFTFTPNATLTADEFITATITPLVDNATTTLSTVGFSTAIRPTITATNSDVSASMSASPNPVAPGGTLLFTISVTNNGPDAATGAFALGSHAGGHDVHFVYRAEWLDRDHARGGGHWLDFRDECDPGPACDRDLLAGGFSQFQRGRSGDGHEFSLSQPDEHGHEFRK